MKRFFSLLCVLALMLCLFSCGKSEQKDFDSSSADSSQNQGESIGLCLYFIDEDYSEIAGAYVMVVNAGNQTEYKTDAAGCVDIKDVNIKEEITISLFDSNNAEPIGSCKIKVERGSTSEYSNGSSKTGDEGYITYVAKEGAGYIYSNLVLTSDGYFESISIK